jgi:type VI secretion system protein ImpA
MASQEVLDFSQLLLPITGDGPAGEDLRADASPNSLYYLVKDARSAARAAERQIVMEDEPSARPDWRPVFDHAVKALAERSKDLEITAYLIEALVRLYGFAGLRDGFRLARGLIEQFWDGLYPLPDEEGLATRVAPLTSLNGDDAEGTLIAPIALVPLTQGSSAGPFALYHYQQAQALGQVQDEQAREKRIKRGAITLETFQRAVAETPASFFSGLVEDLTQCQEEFAQLNVLLEEKCGGRAPPSSNIRAALAACLEAINYVARDKLTAARDRAAIAAEAEAAAGPGNGEAAAAAPGSPAAVAGVIRNREDAFRTLLQLAEYFRRTEPHTPVSYGIEQIVRWGRMSLPELLMELIPDDTSRESFFKQVGIRQEAPPPTDE